MISDLGRARYVPPDHSTSHFAPFDDVSYKTFTPQPSRDAALTSFAQLGTTRLGVQRVMISLFDRTYQHVLTEATPTLSLIGGRVLDNRDRLRLGCCVFPKEKGLCRHVFSRLSSSARSEESMVVDNKILFVSDVRNDPRFKSSSLYTITDARFFASVPIISPRGLTIGAYTVLDDKPRFEKLDTHTVQFLKDMAATVMEHLQMVQSTFKNYQGERMIVGLGSFVEDRATLRDSWHQASVQYAASERSGEMPEGQLNIQQQDIQEAAKGPDQQTQVHRDSVQSGRGASRRSLGGGDHKNLHENEESGKDSTPQKTFPVHSAVPDENPQESMLSNSIKRVFSRAANLIRESIGAEGTIFFDANSERFGSLVDNRRRKVKGAQLRDGTSSSGDESTDSGSSRSKSPTAGHDAGSENTAWSVPLGFATSRASSINDDSIVGRGLEVQEALLTTLLRRYPQGKVFTYNADRSVSDTEGTSQVTSGSDPEDTYSRITRADRHCRVSKKRRRPTFRQDAEHLIRIFPDARNILLVPLWDWSKVRCFAGAFVWTNNPQHAFTTENELVYVSAFANNIMAEVRRLEVEISEKAKTSLVSSISHELRNPLHGILGTSDILSDTAMNALQHGMVHTIESCGRILLDTINNLLDLTFTNKLHQNRGREGSRNALSRGMPKQISGRDQRVSPSHVQLDEVLEEVAECIFAGYSFYHHPQQAPPALVGSSSRTAGGASGSDQLGEQSNQVTVVFDLDYSSEWEFFTHAGAWRRILMNTFGNALKYTRSGFIHIQLKSTLKKASKRYKRLDSEPTASSGDEYEVVIVVRDTGQGISPEYLHNDLFRPFTQENSLTAGGGLGLSIVRQAVGSLGGSIEVSSTPGVGTEIAIRTPLPHFPESSSDTPSTFESLRSQTQGRSIGFLGFGSSLSSERDKTLYGALERICHAWFGLNVSSVSAVDSEKISSHDFYLAVQTELDDEDTGGRNIFNTSLHSAAKEGSGSPVVVICQTPEEAHGVSIAAKKRSQTPNFEFISQPCGPRKLARALDLCIKRELEQQPDEPTRWVEMPESSHLPLNITGSDVPQERLRISKRPTAETMAVPDRTRPPPPSTDGVDTSSSKDHGPTSAPSSKGSEVKPENDSKLSVLLVDDNDLNLQILSAYTKKDNYEYMVAKNGLEAVEIYKAHPGKFRVVLIGMCQSHHPLPFYLFN